MSGFRSPPSAGVFVFAALLTLTALVAGCAPTPDASSTDGLQQILDEVDVDLTNQNCTAALDTILPVYNSSNTDNDVRLRTAAAYGCDAGVNFFDLTSSLTNNATDLDFPAFWAFMVQLFPSETGQDHKMESAFYGLDALESVLNTGVVILPENEVNSGTDNVGSIFTSDRTEDSNLYMIYMAMAGIGTVESRYGTNDGGTTTARANLLPWTTATALDTDGCGLSASVLDFVDSITAAGSELPSSLSSYLSSDESVLLTALNAACAYGCTGAVPNDPIYNPNGTWVASGCNTTCSVCPTTLRNRSSCTGATSDVNSCAAAGIINFLNSSAYGWQS